MALFGGGTVGGAVVELFLKDTNFSKGLAGAETKLASFEKSTGSAAAGMSKFSALAVGAFAAAGVGVLAFAKESIQSYADHQEALDTLMVAIQNSPVIIDKSTKAFEDQATALQNLTGVQDEEILRADAVLARFNLTKDRISQLVPLILDYAQVTHQDAETAATAIGKALLGNTRALKAVGIEFKATGDRAKDVASIMDLLQQKVGGASEAFGATFAGRLKIIQAQFDDLKETVGKELVGAFENVLGPIVQVTTALDTMKVSIEGTDVSLLQFIVHLGTGVGALEGFAGAGGTVAGALDTGRHTLDQFDSSVSKNIDTSDLYHKALKIMHDDHVSLSEAFRRAKAAQDALNGSVSTAIGFYRTAAQMVDLYLGKVANFSTRAGRVPIPGQPLFKQHGFEGFTTRPTMFVTSEFNQPEHVSISSSGDLRQGRGGAAQVVNLHFHAPIYGMADFRREVGSAVALMFAEGAR